MEFPHEVVREYLRLSKETFRYWQRQFPSLSRRKRRSRFTHGEFLALAIVADAHRQDESIKTLAKFDRSLFRACRDPDLRDLPGRYLLFNRKLRTVRFFDRPAELDRQAFEGGTITTDVRSVARELCLYCDFDPHSKRVHRRRNHPTGLFREPAAAFVHVTPNKTPVVEIAPASTLIAFQRFAQELRELRDRNGPKPMDIAAALRTFLTHGDY